MHDLFVQAHRDCCILDEFRWFTFCFLKFVLTSHYNFIYLEYILWNKSMPNCIFLFLFVYFSLMWSIKKYQYSISFVMMYTYRHFKCRCRHICNLKLHSSRQPNKIISKIQVHFSLSSNNQHLHETLLKMPPVFEHTLFTNTVVYHYTVIINNSTGY